MARGRKTGGRDFQKGQPGGPGRPRLPDDIKQSRALTKIELERILNKFMFLSIKEIDAISKDTTSIAIESVVASIVLKAVAFGDQQRLNFVLDRLIGKVKEVLDVNGKISLEELVAGSKEVQ